MFPLSKIRLTDPFWLAWQNAFLQKGLRHQFQQCQDTGRFENFERAARGESSGHQGYYFNDSDVYKWLEAASYALSSHPDWEGKAMVEQAVSIVGNAQEADGYIGTPFQLDWKGKRWKALTAKHEMYCIGHLVEAGVAHRDATESDTLFTIAKRAADCVRDTFGPMKRKGYCGHEEIELAFCRLAAQTGDPTYRELAAWMVEQRGSRPSPFLAEFDDPDGAELNKAYIPLVFESGEYRGAYFQDDLPLAQQTEAVGHAVRAMYLYCGAADACDNAGIAQALNTIFDNLVRKKMYITGGIGSAGKNEGFTTDFDLPNRDAYSETCAAIGLVMWCARMSRKTGDSKYADVMELALYNAALSGVNLDSDRYFYVNPLESRGDHHRQPWFGCACCPPNIARLILSVQQYAAHLKDNVVTIDLPFSAEYSLPEGKLTVESQWPYGREVSIRVEGGWSGQVRLRVPGWAERVSGTDAPVSNGYLVFAGANLDTRVAFANTPKWRAADPRVVDDAGRVALVDGPLVYCLEQCDLGHAVHLFQPDVTQTPTRTSRGDVRWQTNLTVQGSLSATQLPKELYPEYRPLTRQDVTTTFVPYFSWANREPGSMAVWHRV